MDIQSPIDRLNSLLPLKARQDQLTAECRKMHLCILRTLVNEGRVPAEEELRVHAGGDSVENHLRLLAVKDLIVMDSLGRSPVGAYPMTTEQTPYQITVNGRVIYAMCALDALSVASMFKLDVAIDSCCQLSRTPINIFMRDERLIEVHPGTGVTVGILWQRPSGVAAYSMCKQMVFLKDRCVAETWRARNRENSALFSLPQAVSLGKHFFLPLVSELPAAECR